MEKSELPLTCSGVVTDKDTGLPIEGVTIIVDGRLFASPYGIQYLDGPSFRLATDALGRYNFVVPPEYATQRSRDIFIRLKLEHPDYLSANSLSLGFSIPMVAKDDHESRAIHRDIRLFRAEAVAGTVIAPDGKPVAGVEVRGWSWRNDPDFPNTRCHTMTTSDENSRFRLMVMKDGESAVRLFPEKYAASCQLIGKRKGDLGRIVLQQGTVVKGTIFGERGKPVPGVGLVIFALESKTLHGADRLDRFAKSDENGEFRMSPLPAGEYEIFPIEHSGDPRGKDLTRHPLPGVFLRKRVTIKAGRASVSVKFRPVPSVTVEGGLYDSQGNPKDGSGLTLSGELGKGETFCEMAVMAPVGRFSFRAPKGLRRTRLNLQFAGGGRRCRPNKDAPLSNRTEDIDLGILEKDIRGIEVVCYESPAVIVRALTEQGSPLAKYIARLAYAEGKSSAGYHPQFEGGDVDFRTLDDGRRRSVGLLPDEEFALTVEADGFEPSSQSLSLPEGVVRELDVTLRRKP